MEDRETFINLASWIELIQQSDYSSKIFIIGNFKENSKNICTSEQEIENFLGKVKTKYNLETDYNQFNVICVEETSNFINKIIKHCLSEEVKKQKNNGVSISNGNCTIF